MRTVIITSLIAIALVAGVAAARWRDDGSPVTPAFASIQDDAAAPPVVVGATVVRRGTLVLTADAAGEAVAWRDVVVPALTSGQLVRVHVGDGDAVVRGDALARLDDGEARLALREASAALEQAHLSFRELTLLDDRIEDAQVRGERARLARVRSGTDAAEARVSRAQLELERTVVRAPFDGRVAALSARAGSWVSAGHALMRIVEVDPMRVEARVLEGEVSAVRPGAAATVDFSALPGIRYEARVESVDPVIDPVTRTARVTLRVANADARILPGMYAHVRLPMAELPDRLLMQRTALIERDGRYLVFVLEAGRARWRWVTPGDGDEQVVEIVEDAAGTLRPGDVVLTAGHEALADGVPVMVDEHSRAAVD